MQLIKVSSRNVALFSGLIVLSLVLRVTSLCVLHLDDDEGILLLMAQTIANGNLPYVNYWDHQTPLAFYLLVPIVKFFNPETCIFVMRLLGVFIVGSTGFLLSILSKSIFNYKSTAIIGVIYIYSCSWLFPEGLAFNNEVVFNFFLSLSLVILFVFHRRELLSLSAGGFVFGLAFMTKQNVVFEIFPFSVLLIFYSRKILSGCISVIIYFSSSLLPLLLYLFIMSFSGELSSIWDAMWWSNFRYVGQGEYDLINTDAFIKRFTPLFLIYISILVLLFLSQKKSSILIGKKPVKNIYFYLFLSTWYLWLLGCNTLSKTLYLHYFIHGLIPMCLLIYSAWNANLDLFPRVSQTTMKVLGRFFLLISLIAPLLLSLVGMNREKLASRIFPKYREESEVLKYMKDKMVEGETLFTLDAPHIFYFLLNKVPLSRFAFPDHLLRQKYEKMIPLDQTKELHQIFQKKPKWILRDLRPESQYRLTDNEELSSLIEYYMRNNYILTYKACLEGNRGGIFVYRLKNHN